MGRRSIAVERRRQIITVTIQCIATHGVAGTTLERIADTAGMARGHVRHFVGNRDELLTDAARVFYFGDGAMDESDIPTLLATSPTIDRQWSLEQAMDYLFGEFAAPGTDNAAAIAWVDASRTMPAIHEIVLSAYAGISASMRDAIAAAHPDAPDADCQRVATALLALAIGTTFMTDLEPSQDRIDDARSAGEELLARLARSRV